MEITSQAKSLTLKSVFVVIIFCVLLWFSIFSYALLYYLYIPAIAHVKPIYFRYDTLCNKEENCFFPYDNITLIEKERYEILSSGQAYAVEVVLMMPESERNIKQGMFMIHVDMLSQSGEVLKTSRRPAMLHYRSPLFKFIYTIFYVPALLLGSIEEKQSLTIPIFEKYVEDAYKPTYYAFVELEADIAEVYSCQLNIHAQFTGLRYMMYYWPVLSAALGIGVNFAASSCIVLLVWIRQILNGSHAVDAASLSEQERGLIREIRQSVHRSRQGAGSERLSSSTISPTEEQGVDAIEELSHHLGQSSTAWLGETSAASGKGDSEEDRAADDFEQITAGRSPTSSPEASPLLRRRGVAAVAE